MHRLFAVTVFTGAALLFTVEPLVGRLLLPLAGGTPSVWTTCLLFFQTALLAGYAYAHAIGDRLSLRAQVPLHLLVIALPAMALPFAVDSTWFVGTGHPVLTLLPLLAKTVGLPFFALATTAPLMQRWFTAAEPKRDPYPLYAASNVGSLLALAAYPFLLEPALGLTDQGRWWAVGYGAFALLVAGCGFTVWKAPAAAISAPLRVAANPANYPWVRWLLLSLAPSSLLMSVTTTITTDITPVPLLWVVPLGLYLLTFIIAFAGRQIIPHGLVVRLAPIATLAMFFILLLTNLTDPWWLILLIHLGGFFIVALACHGELARLKPPVQGLTRFYLIMSIGGALGGLFNAVIAPVIFEKLGLVEYSWGLILAIALLPNKPRGQALAGIPELTGPSSFAYPLIVGALTGIAVFVCRVQGWTSDVAGGVVFGVPLVLVYLLVDRPVRMAVGLAMLWAASLMYISSTGRPIYFERNFFGLKKISAEFAVEVSLATGKPVTGQKVVDAHVLFHGSTVHGRQSWKTGGERVKPLTYYGEPGPIGDVFRVINARPPSAIAVCGLGAGTLACYAKPGQSWTFFEIDPGIVRIAKDPELFTYLADKFPAGKGVEIALGDARLEIAKVDNGRFGLIVLDAFSSDSIPVHLLTREALAMYRDKLAPGGIIAFHISNRYLDLRPVVSSAARDLGLTARYRREDVDEAASQEGRTSSQWVALTRSESDLGPLAVQWDRLPELPKGFRTWTDDYSNLLSVFMLGQ